MALVGDDFIYHDRRFYDLTIPTVSKECVSKPGYISPRSASIQRSISASVL